MMSRKFILLAGGAAGALLAASPAFAQNTSVSERAGASYGPQGIPAGSFRFYPELYLGVGYTDNAYANDDYKEESTIGVATASANLVSDWGLHELNIYGDISTNTYFDEGDADNYTGSVGFDGRLDMARGFAGFGGAEYAKGVESLVDNPADGLLEPPEYETVSANVGYTASLGRLSLEMGVAGSDYNYDDTRLFDNTITDQDFRDFRAVTGTIRTGTEVTADTSVFLEFNATGTDYDQEGTAFFADRDSDTYELLVGSDFDITNLIRGTASIGGFTRSFEDPALDSYEGIAANVGLEWFATPLLTVEFDVNRSAGESAIQSSPGVTSTAISTGAFYEYKPNIILRGGVWYDKLDYEGLDRTEHTFGVDTGLDYYINRFSAIALDLSYASMEGNGADARREYDALSALVGIRLYR